MAAGTVAALAREQYVRCGRGLLHALYDGGCAHLARVHQDHLPLPELAIHSGNPTTAGRGGTSWKKWRLIKESLPAGARLALDVGCNNGFFSLRLASQGLLVLGVDPDADLLRLAQIASLRCATGQVAFCPMAADPKNVRQLPDVDVTLALSVMQRWVRLYGPKAASGMLRTLWAKTRLCLYFEVPNPSQNSKEARVLRYFGKTEAACERFLRKMLRGLGGSDVRLLGYLPTDFRPGERRHLFRVRRVGRM